MEKRNILIIMTDQQRADRRASKGFALDTMPFLDSWASGATEIENAYTPNPTCMPARVSMFTGRYPQAHRVRTNHNAQDALYTRDLLDIVRARGYKTALFGKNHTHHPAGDFDVHFTNGHLGGPDLPGDTPQMREFRQFLNSEGSIERHQPSPGGLEVQFPYRNVSDALRFFAEQKSANSPFFAWVSFAEPHTPNQVPKPYYDLFPPESLPPVATGPEALAQKGERYVWLRDIWERVMGEDYEMRVARTRSNYYGMMRLIDDQIKRLFEGLGELGLEQETIVLFVSDHGDFDGEYGLTRKGADLSEALVRIPMIWKVPGLEGRGPVSGACANIVDILPTLCDLLGEELPLGCQGKSLVPLLQGAAPEDGEFDCAYSQSGYGGLYWHGEDSLSLAQEGASKNYKTFDTLNSWTQSGQVRMLRKGGYKLQMDMMGSAYLYHLPSDPHEIRNLWDSPEHMAARSEMTELLLREELRCADSLPLPRKRYWFKRHRKGCWPAKALVPDSAVEAVAPKEAGMGGGE